MSISWSKVHVLISCITSLIFVVVVAQLLSCVWLSETPWAVQTRLLCPPLPPGVCSDSCPLSRWCYPLPSIFPSIRNSALFQEVCSSHQVAKVSGLQLQYQSFQWIFRVDFVEDWLVWSPCWLRDSQESSPAPQFKIINSLALSHL